MTKTEISPDLIEKIIYNPMSVLPKIPMTKSITEIMIRMLLCPQKTGLIPDNEKPFLYRLIESRIKASFTFSVNDERFILLLCAVSKTPGSAILYLWYLQGWCKINGIKVLDLDIACEEIFGLGFFKEEELQMLWESQKGYKLDMPIDNLVDVAEAGKSLQF